jgi:hypothetical protein
VSFISFSSNQESPSPINFEETPSRSGSPVGSTSLTALVTKASQVISSYQAEMGSNFQIQKLIIDNICVLNRENYVPRDLTPFFLEIIEKNQKLGDFYSVLHFDWLSLGDQIHLIKGETSENTLFVKIFESRVKRVERFRKILQKEILSLQIKALKYTESVKKSQNNRVIKEWTEFKIVAQELNFQMRGVPDVFGLNLKMIHELGTCCLQKTQKLLLGLKEFEFDQGMKSEGLQVILPGMLQILNEIKAHQVKYLQGIKNELKFSSLEEIEKAKQTFQIYSRLKTKLDEVLERRDRLVLQEGLWLKTDVYKTEKEIEAFMTVYIDFLILEVGEKKGVEEFMGLFAKDLVNKGMFFLKDIEALFSKMKGPSELTLEEVSSPFLKINEIQNQLYYLNEEITSLKKVLDEERFSRAFETLQKRHSQQFFVDQLNASAFRSRMTLSRDLEGSVEAIDSVVKEVQKVIELFKR